MKHKHWREAAFKEEFCRLLAERMGWSVAECELIYGEPGHRFGEQPADAVEAYVKASAGDMDKEDEIE
ncbi:MULTISPECIES: hypothetical protein [unclassified Rhodanobacter]|uniref:hypothetical protein n=1 Tax=unclassified Rhodanobacter TaxID=2621553 RepID=UPI0007AA205A|nr:hypothetical protein [Rhodanobacter sp. FW510-R10]KZC32616.1 hypothetical protein RhoFW510R10_11925 [Rhodanobacter sp. FW510-R10]